MGLLMDSVRPRRLLVVVAFVSVAWLAYILAYGAPEFLVTSIHEFKLQISTTISNKLKPSDAPTEAEELIDEPIKESIEHTTPTVSLDILTELATTLVTVTLSTETSLPSPESTLQNTPPTTLHPPSDYEHPPSADNHCQHTYGLPYLEYLRDSVRPYCEAPSSHSTLDCFNIDVNGERRDVFCVSQSNTTIIPKKQPKPFTVDCKTRDWDSSPDLNISPKIERFPIYLYETGPGYIINNFVTITAPKTETAINPRAPIPPCSNDPTETGYKILLKREGEGNPWHTLLEIFSFYLTLDVLSMTFPPSTNSAPEPKSQTPYLTPSIAFLSQAVILDQRLDGQFFHLWAVPLGLPTIRLAELPPPKCGPYNFILPLPGGSNPLWQSDWHPQGCAGSVLVDTFSRRLLRSYNVTHDGDIDSKTTTNEKDEKKEAAKDGEKKKNKVKENKTLLPVALAAAIKNPEDNTSPNITVTIIARTNSRRLASFSKLVSAIQTHFNTTTSLSPHHSPLPPININALDFSTLPFATQLRIVRSTDVLVGVHGAGLIHSIFMKRGQGAVVEIFPPELVYPVYRNLAKLGGLRYFSAHAARAERVVGVGEKLRRGLGRLFGRGVAVAEGEAEKMVWLDDGGAGSVHPPGEEGRIGKRDWHEEDLAIEEKTFVELVDLAVRSTFNSRTLAVDVV